jgi:hypothetical protein
MLSFLVDLSDLVQTVDLGFISPKDIYIYIYKYNICTINFYYNFELLYYN